MNTQQIAKELVGFCRAGKFEDAQKKLYSSDAVSIEQSETPGFAKETKGLPAIIEKGHQWEKGVAKIHKIEVSDPVVAGDTFATAMKFDIAMKEGGRMDLSELALYQVKDGKIASEQFYM